MFQLFLKIFGLLLTIGINAQASNTYMHAVNLETIKDYENQDPKFEQSVEAFLASHFPVAEGDIIINDSGDLVMGHHLKPGEQAQTFPFKKWFQTLLTSTQTVDSHQFPGFSQKGLKMDIKENPFLNEEFHLPKNAATLKVRDEIWELLNDPTSGITLDLLNSRFIIVNADIVKGPGAFFDPAVSVEDLMLFRRDFPQMRISVGYTQGGDADPYTKEMLDAQLENARKLGGNIDFNLREIRIEASLPQLQSQLKSALESPEITSVTVTIWNAPAIRDPEVSQEKLNWYSQVLFPQTLPPGKNAAVYFDVYKPWTLYEFGHFHLTQTPYWVILHYFTGF